VGLLVAVWWGMAAMLVNDGHDFCTISGLTVTRRLQRVILLRTSLSGKGATKKSSMPVAFLLPSKRELVIINHAYAGQLMCFL
jgi:hypothetical protein